VPNMGLTSWRGSIVRKQDVAIAKNYLNTDEIKELNEIVIMYLDYDERQARQRKTVTMEQWADKLGGFLEFNEQKIFFWFQCSALESIIGRSASFQQDAERLIKHSNAKHRNQKIYQALSGHY